ncbi:hypothetical protein RvVAR0630_12280 [Agrobacterium vitis]|nr:hypothetical protein RvVAR0630_12280 [Agrobacterium vitis]
MAVRKQRKYTRLASARNQESGVANTGIIGSAAPGGTRLEWVYRMHSKAFRHVALTDDGHVFQDIGFI